MRALVFFTIRKTCAALGCSLALVASATGYPRVQTVATRTLCHVGAVRTACIGCAENAGHYEHIIQQASHYYEIDQNLIRAVIMAESRYDQYLISSAGAQGLMQLMPETAHLLGVRDIFDPEENIMAGTRFLKNMLVMFDYDLGIALAAYNAGPNRVKQWGGRIPPIVETRAYVRKVLRFYRTLAEHELISLS